MVVEEKSETVGIYVESHSFVYGGANFPIESDDTF